MWVTQVPHLGPVAPPAKNFSLRGTSFCSLTIEIQIFILEFQSFVLEFQSFILEIQSFILEMQSFIPEIQNLKPKIPRS